MFVVGTRFRGSGEGGVMECVVNKIENGNFNYCVVYKGQPMTPASPSTPCNCGIHWAEDLVKRGHWIILSQPFKVYLKQCELCLE